MDHSGPSWAGAASGLGSSPMLLSRRLGGGRICMTSPFTRCSITVESSSTASRLRRRASEMEARASRKSPAKMAILLPNTRLTDGAPRRVSALSITSSWNSDAVWIISVISASRRCLSLIWPPLQADATSSTIVGRIFLPPSSAKKYCAHACSTGWSDPKRCLMLSPRDTMWPSTRPKGSAVNCIIWSKRPVGWRRSASRSSTGAVAGSATSTVGRSTKTCSKASEPLSSASTALSRERLATALAT
mmetsp:Transcript_8830/g.33337  ORF Transcript_8830/g.33337 Transcript_8830/m.33337 type:complete len:246 (-) Transcript_8830:24-761(-)